MPKTVPDSKFQEWKGLDQISPIVHEMKCIFREISKDDFGIDGEIEIVVPKPDGQGFQTTGSFIKVQAKSGMSYVKQDSDNEFSSPVKKDDLEFWYGVTYPVLYIVYHPGDDKLYWKEIHSYVKNTPNVWMPPFRIVFNKIADEFTPACYEALCSLAIGSSPSRLSFTQQERLFSNLLKIKRLPPVWSAPTREKRYDRVRGAIHGFVPPFTIFSGRLYSLSNLNETDCVLRQHCDVSDIHPESVETWWDDDALRREYVFLLNQLLGIHVRRCKLRYNRQFARNYFPREEPGRQEFKRGWYNIRTHRNAPERITAKFYRYGLDSFWRHTAADFSFRMISGSWFLQIIPKYFFTEDGITPWASDKVGSYTTRLKAKETNQHVLNHLLFWIDTLSHGKANSVSGDEINIQLDFKTVMVIEKLPLAGIANFSIPFDPAVYEEPEITGQMSFFTWPDQESEDGDDY
ncbi:MAG: DUF4365 domain-containing protein [Thermoflexales bacterium]|nr:DUF4365 domain-containing protein [Thermoflexales bacterium]